MSQSILTILLITFAMVVIVWLLWPRRIHRIRGPVAELEPRIARLVQTSPETFLIVKVRGTNDFLQLTATPDGAEIDFPLVTERQQAIEPRIRQAATDLQLGMHETRCSDGSRFLDFDVRGTPADVAEACRHLLVRIFGVTDDASLVYETNEHLTSR